MQEARFPSSSAFSVKHHHVITSACDRDGHGGCALLLAKDVPYGFVGSKALFLRADHAHVVTADRDMLAVRVKAPGVHFLCVVAHSPHAKSPTSVREAWWKKLRRVLTGVR